MEYGATDKSPPTGWYRIVITATIKERRSNPSLFYFVIILLMLRHTRQKKRIHEIAINTIVSAKTGVLTSDKPVIQKLWHPNASSDHFTRLLALTINKDEHTSLDTALLTYTTEKGIYPPRYFPFKSFTFHPSIAMSGNIWHKGSEYDLILKGMPERILSYCDITENEYEKAIIEFHKLARHGFQVIAIAHKVLSRPIAELDELHDIDRLVFDGFIATMDSLQTSTKAAFEKASQTGIDIRILTGDHPETTYYIAGELGIVDSWDEVFDAREIDIMTDDEVEMIMPNIRVFVRATPDHKRRILNLLGKHDNIVIAGNNMSYDPTIYLDPKK